MSTPARSVLEEYIVYRLRFRQLCHLSLLLKDFQSRHVVLASIPASELQDVTETLQVVALGWLASLVDPHPSALNVFRLWRGLFPHRELDIARAERALQPYMEKIISLRSTVAFHANKSPRAQIGAWESAYTPELLSAIDEFAAVADALREEEHQTPALSEIIREIP
jgi:hypothetical protein